jgi:hypothetical protein
MIQIGSHKREMSINRALPELLTPQQSSDVKQSLKQVNSSIREIRSKVMMHRNSLMLQQISIEMYLKQVKIILL